LDLSILDTLAEKVELLVDELGASRREVDTLRGELMEQEQFMNQARREKEQTDEAKTLARQRIEALLEKIEKEVG
jgi:hypothetical protein